MKTVVFGLVLIAVGLAALHYVNPEDAEHHREWALASGFSEPTFLIGAVGAGALGLGALLLGWRIGRGRTRPAT